MCPCGISLRRGTGSWLLRLEPDPLGCRCALGPCMQCKSNTNLTSVPNLEAAATTQRAKVPAVAQAHHVPYPPVTCASRRVQGWLDGGPSSQHLRPAGIPTHSRRRTRQDQSLRQLKTMACDCSPAVPCIGEAGHGTPFPSSSSSSSSPSHA